MTKRTLKDFLRFFKNIIEEAVSRAKLTTDGLYRLYGKADELLNGVTRLIVSLSREENFPDEDKGIICTVDTVYKQRNTLEVHRLLDYYFPGLETCNEQIALRAKPEGAIGSFIVPRWQRTEATYNQALALVLEKLAKMYGPKFANLLAQQPGALGQDSKTVKAMSRIGNSQPDSNFLILFAQLGTRHLGRSARRAREMMSESEFGLNVFTVACILLAHQEYVRDHGFNSHRIIMCGGDRFILESGKTFTPCFIINGGNILFDIVDESACTEDHGMATGFIE